MESLRGLGAVMSELEEESLIETVDLRIKYNGRNVIWNIQTPGIYC